MEENAQRASHVEQLPLAFVPFDEGEAFSKIPDIGVFTLYGSVGNAILEIIVVPPLIVWSCIHRFEISSFQWEIRRDQPTVPAAYDLKAVQMEENLKLSPLTQVAGSLVTGICFRLNVLH